MSRTMSASAVINIYIYITIYIYILLYIPIDIYIIYIYIYIYIFILDQCLHPPYRQMKENYTKSQMSLSIVLTASLSKASLALDCQSLTESC